jgi:uncharacterized protein (TIGR02588 family)
MTKRHPGSNKKFQHVPAWEWAVAAVGAVVVTGMLGFMGYRALQADGERIPDLHVEARAIHARGESFVVVVDVRNDGGGDAALVAIEGELVDAGTTLETSDASLSYVPAGSQREAGLLFTYDPARYQLRLRATGYEKP